MSYWQNKTALVTGASAGFGRALTQALVDAGAGVAMVDLDEQRLQEEVGQLQAGGYQVVGLATDVTKSAQVQDCVDRVLDRFGSLDLLANVVGRSMRGLALETSLQSYRDLLELNFLSMVTCSTIAVPHLLKTRGHLVNMGSLAAKSAAPYLGAYAVSKFAVAAFSQQLRYELGPQGVHVLLVCPGPMQRADAGRRYDGEADGLPAAARAPGGGVRLSGIAPARLARLVLRSCEGRRPELVVPGKARLVFAVSQLWPSLGDRILQRFMKKEG
jgi:NAD(P)-dependent dehydrogenase (short-subunit alcohol dehydrogenase family)